MSTKPNYRKLYVELGRGKGLGGVNVTSIRSHISKIVASKTNSSQLGSVPRHQFAMFGVCIYLYLQCTTILCQFELTNDQPYL